MFKPLGRSAKLRFLRHFRLASHSTKTLSKRSWAHTQGMRLAKPAVAHQTLPMPETETATV
jgi:hypothetical protein